MGCLEFWAVNSLIGSVMFFILFLVIEIQPQYYPYKIEDKGDSSTAVILASIGYAGLGVGLICWHLFRQRRLAQAQQYQASINQGVRSTVLKAPQIEL